MTPASSPTGDTAVLVARCENYREDIDAQCAGEIRFRWGMSQSTPCDICGARCGIAVAKWDRVVSSSSPDDTAPARCPSDWEREMRAFLGKAVTVRLTEAGSSPEASATGVLHEFDTDGQVRLLCDDGAFHWCWPALDVRLAGAPAEDVGVVLRNLAEDLKGARSVARNEGEAQRAAGIGDALDLLRKLIAKHPRRAGAVPVPAPAPGYDRIAQAIETACEVADVSLDVHSGLNLHSPAQGYQRLARILDKAGLIDWFAFTEPSSSSPDDTAPAIKVTSDRERCSCTADACLASCVICGQVSLEGGCPAEPVPADSDTEETRHG